VAQEQKHGHDGQQPACPGQELSGGQVIEFTDCLRPAGEKFGNFRSGRRRTPAVEKKASEQEKGKNRRCRRMTDGPGGAAHDQAAAQEGGEEEDERFKEGGPQGQSPGRGGEEAPQPGGLGPESDLRSQGQADQQEDEGLMIGATEEEAMNQNRRGCDQNQQGITQGKRQFSPPPPEKGHQHGPEQGGSPGPGQVESGGCDQTENPGQPGKKQVHWGGGVRFRSHGGILKIMGPDGSPGRLHHLLHPGHTRVTIRIDKIDFPAEKHLAAVPTAQGQGAGQKHGQPDPGKKEAQGFYEVGG